MIKSLQVITSPEEMALMSSFEGESQSELASNAAQKVIMNLGMRHKELNLTPADVMNAFADGSKLLSAEGAYYKLQAFLLDHVGAIGATAVTAAGIAQIISWLKDAGSAAFKLVSGAVGTFASVATPASAGTSSPSLWRRLFGLGARAVGLDEVRDEDAVSAMDPNYLSLAMATSVPTHVTYLVNEFSRALSQPQGAPINGGGMASLAPPLPAPKQAQPTSTPSASSSSSGGGILSALGGVVSSVGKDIGGLISSGLSAIGLDEVRDEVRDEMQDDIDAFGTFLAKKYGLHIPPHLQARIQHDGAPVNAEI